MSLALKQPVENWISPLVHRQAEFDRISKNLSIAEDAILEPKAVLCEACNEWSALLDCIAGVSGKNGAEIWICSSCADPSNENIKQHYFYCYHCKETIDYADEEVWHGTNLGPEVWHKVCWDKQ